MALFALSTQKSSLHDPAGFHAVRTRILAKDRTRTERRDVLLERQREWLANLVKWTGLKLSPLAREAGVNTTTLTRATSEEWTSLISSEVVSAIKSRFGVPGPDEDPDSYRAGFRESEQISYEALDQRTRRIIDALCGGDLTVGVFRLKSRALEHSGYVPGDILAVSLGAEPEDGDVVCLQVYDFDAGSAETAFRLYEDGLFVTQTMDASIKRFYSAHDRSVKVMGVVVGSVRPKRAARAAASVANNIRPT